MQWISTVHLPAQPLARNGQLGGQLVNERPGTARALVIHAGRALAAIACLPGVEEQNLGVLSAQLDGRLGVGIASLNGQRDRIHFLYEPPAGNAGDLAGPGSRQAQPDRSSSQTHFTRDSLQEIKSGAALLGFVPAIILPDDPVLSVRHHDRLDGCGPDVEADQ
jgi:hypothetical protein